MLTILPLIFYFAGSLAQASTLLHSRNSKSVVNFCFGVPAIILHGYLLYGWIDSSAGQNLTEFNLFSLATWLTALVSLSWWQFVKPVGLFNYFLFPLGGNLSILFSEPISLYHIIQTAAETQTHSAYSVVSRHF